MNSLVLLSFLIKIVWSTIYVPRFDTIVLNHKSSDTLIVDRNNQVLHRTRHDYTQRTFLWTPINELSPLLIKSTVAIEDKRYWNHFGLDLLSTLGALFQLIKDPTHRRLRGASTITMQLASLLNPSLRSVGAKSVGQKIFQILLALKIEQYWTKEQILEAYFNLVPFRGEFIGIMSTSLAFFQKLPLALNKIESILLAGLIQRPNRDRHQLFQRACNYQNFIFPEEKNCSELKKIIEINLKNPKHIPQKNNLAFHVTQNLIQNQEQQKPNLIKTTLDKSLQLYNEQLLINHLKSMRWEYLKDGAILVVKNDTGEVLSYVGGSGPMSDTPYVDGVKAFRQAASTLKPLIYAKALDQKLITASSLLEDAPVNIQTQTNGIYHPSNYDDNFHGLVTARQALASSLNIPAIKVLNLVGLASILKDLRLMDFDVPFEEDFYGLSLALGSIDVTLWDMVGLYRMLAEKGWWSPLTLVQGEQHKRRIISSQASFIINNILSDPAARTLTFGEHSILKRPYWTMVKTGTSKDMRDNWCIGHSQHYTVGVWVGNMDGKNMHHVNGLTGAGPIWVQIMDYLHQQVKSFPPPIPTGIVQANIQIASSKSDHSEYFITGTAPRSNKVYISAPTSSTPKIIYPVNNMLMAIDHDIPSSHQLVKLESNYPLENFEWKLNGKLISQAGKTVFWKPIIGNHLLALIGKEGKTVDTVQFEVR